MASTQNQGQPAPGGHHQRTKSSVLRSFMMHRRGASQGDGLATAASVTATAGKPGPLEACSHNRQHPQAAGFKMPLSVASQAPVSPTKTNFAAGRPFDIATHIPGSGYVNNENAPPASPTKKSRPKSTAGLSGLLSRPKSLKNLRAAAGKDTVEPEVYEDDRQGRSRSPKKSDDKKRDKSRRNVKDDTKANSAARSVLPSPATEPQITPIYAQFCSTSKAQGKSDLPTSMSAPSAKPRPKSFHPSAASSNSSVPSASSIGASSVMEPPMAPADIDVHLEALLERRNIPEHQRYKMRSLGNTIKMELIRQDWAEEKAKREKQQQQQQQQNSVSSDRPPSHEHESVRSTSGTGSAGDAGSLTNSSANGGSAGKASKSKHSRVKSMTFSRVTRGRSRDRSGETDSAKRPKSPGAALRRRAEETFGRHLRSKSTESLSNLSSAVSSPDEPATSSGGAGGAIAGFFKARVPQHNSPADFVTYLRTTQAPEKVEVGKLHKLRLLLRNETVAWIEDFIGQGGMEEVVSLLYRIMAVEWREEHEDALLHENLLCLKALCTTALALQYLHSIQATLLPALIKMIFDPEKKGPSEFTTRNIVTWVLFTYIQNAPASERPARAQTVLGYLRDPESDEKEQPVSFVLEMRKDRPYRVWCKEVVNVTKEVFWIFLHHLNVVSLPAGAAKDRKPVATDAPVADELDYKAQAQAPPTATTPPAPPKHADNASYMVRHFPKERPPVPAAPYVGGVEWEATNYLASHLELVNAILACTPTAAERNHLRKQMQMSGWEKGMGSTLRLCKEKFYGAVHDGLRVWVAAAYEDGWDVRDVRYGPPPPPAASPERRNHSPNKKTNAVGGPRAEEPAPKLEIPKLDFILD